MDQAVVQWTGFPGGPGYTNFYFTTDVGGGAALQTFFAAVAPMLPSTVKIQVPSSGPQLNPLTGEQTGVWTTASHPQIAGLAGGKYSAASGACVTWVTGVFVRGRRVRGRTFLVPLESGCYAPDGTIDDGTRTIMNAAVATFVTATSPGHCIYVRNRKNHTDEGIACEVVSGNIRDRIAILTSRRV